MQNNFIDLPILNFKFEFAFKTDGVKQTLKWGVGLV